MARGSRKHRAAAQGGSQPQPVEAPRASLYAEITARIVAEMEAGRVPWIQPWGPGTAGAGLPRNAVTGRPYSGINVLILWGAVIGGGYPSQSWLTFRQALAAGGAVRKGERGTCVVYADHFVSTRSGTGATGTDGDRRDEGEQTRPVPFLRRFTVFNLAQCEGLREDLAGDAAPLPEREIVPVAETLIAASGVDFRVGGDKAFYVPSLDFVAVPPQPAFFDQINWYRTALHELTHATGHKSRLDRNLASAFGTSGYAREELVAEIGSAFLCAALGIVPTVRHADYLGSWLDVLREDNRAIFRAASQASKAADWLLARRDAAEASSTACAAARACAAGEEGAA